MRHTEPKEVVAVAQEIMAYLAAHPMAADSIVGISQWWLLSRHGEQSERVVEQALYHLIRTGLVKREPSADGTSIYSRTERRGARTSASTLRPPSRKRDGSKDGPRKQ